MPSLKSCSTPISFCSQALQAWALVGSATIREWRDGHEGHTRRHRRNVFLARLFVRLLPGCKPGGTREPGVAQRMFGDFDPKLAEITDNVLFADVWERPGLTKHDRSLITIAALIAMNRLDQLRSHMQRGRANGVTKEEVVEVITQLAFYTGWPNAVSAIAVAKETFK